MKSSVLKWTMKLLSAAGLAVASYVFLLVHPEPLFSNSVTYSGITFYSQQQLSPSARGLAAVVRARIAVSPLYEPAGQQRVFVVEKPWLWALLNGPYRGAMARNVEFGNAILLPSLSEDCQELVHFDGRRASAADILVHEAVHTLVGKRIGVLRVWRLEWWQKEGYPEYIASSARSQPEVPVLYQDAVAAWQYLLEMRHLSVDEVLRLHISLAEVLSERRRSGGA